MTKYQVFGWLPAVAVGALAVLTLNRVVTPDDASKWLTIGSFIVSTSFLVVYTVMGRWWRSPEGRTTVGLVAVIAGVTGYVVTALIWGPYLGRNLVRFVTWAGVFLACSRITVLLIRRQRQGRADRAAIRARGAGGSK